MPDKYEQDIIDIDDEVSNAILDKLWEELGKEQPEPVNFDFTTEETDG